MITLYSLSKETDIKSITVYIWKHSTVLFSPCCPCCPHCQWLQFQMSHLLQLCANSRWIEKNANMEGQKKKNTGENLKQKNLSNIITEKIYIYIYFVKCRL